MVADPGLAHPDSGASASGSRAAGGRLGLVSRLLLDALAAVPGNDPAAVLDCGGGSGAYAVPLALAGARVTVLDVSADALALLRRRSVEAGVADSVDAVQGDAENLGASVASGSADLVLLHGVLDVVADVGAVLGAAAATVRPGGVISVLVANPAAAVLARALGGDPVDALAEFRATRSAEAAGRLGPDPGSVRRIADDLGLVVEARHGVGVFSDLVPGAALDTPGARAAVADLDAEAAAQPPFVDIAGRIHLLLRRPGGPTAGSRRDADGT